MTIGPQVREVTLDALGLLSILREDLHRIGRLALRVAGDSMWPAIPDGTTVILVPIVPGSLAEGQVVCFAEGSRVRLHRVVGLERNGRAILCGDNNHRADGAVDSAQILARVQDAPPKVKAGPARRASHRLAKMVGGFGQLRRSH